MSHLFDPPGLVDESAYMAALDELDDLLLAEPGTPAGYRVAELRDLIDDYLAQRDGYDLARMKRLLAGSG